MFHRSTAKKMRTYDWSIPQRQPFAGLGVVFLNTLWEVVKRLWPFALLMLLNGKPGKVNRYEVMGLVLLVLTIAGSIIQFLYFRFYISNGSLIIRKGWIKKELKQIPFEKIQSIHLEQGPVHQALNIVKVSIDTAGSQNTEAVIDALHRSKAEALRSELLRSRGTVSKVTDLSSQETETPPLLQLNGSDLLRLSLSANHLETFFLILTFVLGLWNTFSDFQSQFVIRLEDWFPEGSFVVIMIFAFTALFLTIFTSTLRIFLTFYNHKVVAIENGLQVSSGLTHIKERAVPFDKVQYISWKANWIRKAMGLWLFEYAVAGGFDLKDTQRIKVPLTRDDYVPLLSKSYADLPPTEPGKAIRMHHVYAARRLILVGLMPLFVLVPLLWLAWGAWAMALLFWPVLTYTLSYQTQRKFRLWVSDHTLYLRKGWFGEEHLLFRWEKLQSVKFSQSIFQRKRGIATVELHTAGGTISLAFIPQEAALKLVNLSLYKAEISPETQAEQQNIGAKLVENGTTEAQGQGGSL